MKKIVILALAIGMLVTSCSPASVTDVPAPAVDLNATADVFVQQTLQALPSFTTAPTNTPVVETVTTTPSETPTVQAETSTVNPTTTSGTVAITSTETLTTTTLTNIASSFTLTPATLPSTSTATLAFTPNPNATATETLHSRFYGTLPPNVPHNSLELVNKSKAEAYISLQVTVADGSTTIIEYPVGGLFAVQVPVGRYKYVAWVGGNKITGSFVLDKDTDLRLIIYKDRVEVKTR